MIEVARKPAPDPEAFGNLRPDVDGINTPDVCAGVTRRFTCFFT
jgi:hypothetical protein